MPPIYYLCKQKSAIRQLFIRATLYNKMDNMTENLRHLTLGQLKEIIDRNDVAKVNSLLTENLGVTMKVTKAVLGSFVHTPLYLPEMRLIMVRRGTASPTINLLRHSVEAGTLMFFAPHSIVEANNLSDDLEGEGITMTDDFFHLTVGDHLPPAFDGRQRDFRLRLNARQMAYAEELLHLIYQSIRTTEAHAQVTIHLASAFLWYVNNLWQQQQQREQQGFSREQQLFTRFIALVNEQAATHHTIDFYASALCLSPRYMGRLIKEVSGRSAKEWIDDAIVTGAKVRLKHSDRLVRQIADEMNFPNVSFFCKYFKRMTGLTPNEYKHRDI